MTSHTSPGSEETLLKNEGGDDNKNTFHRNKDNLYDRSKVAIDADELDESGLYSKVSRLSSLYSSVMISDDEYEDDNDNDYSEYKEEIDSRSSSSRRSSGSFVAHGSANVNASSECKSKYTEDDDDDNEEEDDDEASLLRKRALQLLCTSHASPKGGRRTLIKEKLLQQQQKKQQHLVIEEEDETYGDDDDDEDMDNDNKMNGIVANDWRARANQLLKICNNSPSLFSPLGFGGIGVGRERGGSRISSITSSRKSSSATSAYYNQGGRGRFGQRIHCIESDDDEDDPYSTWDYPEIYSKYEDMRRRRQRTKRILCVTAMIILLLIGVGATVFSIARMADSSSNGRNSSSTVGTISPANGGKAEQRAENEGDNDDYKKGDAPSLSNLPSIVLEFLSQASTSTEDWSNPHSAQIAAASWFVADDYHVEHHVLQYGVDLDSDNIIAWRALERFALATLFFATGGDMGGWIKGTNWLSKLHVCEWYGIKCDHNLRVLELNLAGNNLNGIIPGEIGVLEQIEKLDLSDNQLHGNLPYGLGRQLVNLVEFRVSRNEIRGTLDDSTIGVYGNLEVLHMDSNMMEGRIPTWFELLRSLKSLNLAYNKFTDEIPEGMGVMHDLKYLDLSNNRLWGEIPYEIGELAKLEKLVLADNELSGSLPSSFVQLSNLRKLCLNENKFTGEVGGWLGILHNLEEVHLDNNQFSGVIPNEVGYLSGLTEVSLHGNAELGGIVPNALCGLGLRVLTADCLGENAAVDCGCCTKCYDPSSS